MFHFVSIYHLILNFSVYSLANFVKHAENKPVFLGNICVNDKYKQLTSLISCITSTITLRAVNIFCRAVRHVW